MNITYSDLEDALVELVDCKVEFLPPNNNWSKSKQKNLMLGLEKFLTIVKESSFRIGFLSGGFEVSVGHNSGGSIAINAPSEPEYVIKSYNCNPCQFDWMDAGKGGNNKWRTWTNTDNFVTPDECGHSIIKFYMRNVPRVIAMAYVNAIYDENYRNLIITSEHPPPRNILWEAFKEKKYIMID